MRFACAYRRLVVAAFVVVFGLLPAAGALWAKPHAKHVARDEVADMENQWVKFQIAGDAQGMDKLLSQDFLGITATGEVVTKAQQLDRMKNRELVVRSLHISDVRVKLLGQRAAIVTSLAQLDGTSEGHPLVGSFRYTHVYQKLPNGMWSITNFEATRIRGGAMTVGSAGSDGSLPQR